MIDELALDLKKAKAKIHKNRLLAWCSNEGQSSVGKITLLPLTAKAWVDLNVIDNKFICGGNKTSDDIMQYLWRNSDKYNADASRKTNKAKKYIGYLFAQSNTPELEKLIYEHIYLAFEEFPQAITIQSDAINTKNTFPEIDGIVGIVDEVASRYGQNPTTVLNWPMNRIFQLQKAIRLATIPNYKLAEPKLIKIIKQEILEELNNGTES